MKSDHYFYNCSKEYIDTIDVSLFTEISEVVESLPKRETQSKVNQDLFWFLTKAGWAYDSAPAGLSEIPPPELQIENHNKTLVKEKYHIRNLCLSSTTLDAIWRSDFAKLFGKNLVQLEAQFGQVESMFKDFCGFRIAYSERRLALGIEIVMSEPIKYFSHRKSSISGMAYFEIAKKMLPTIGLHCPIWLIGIRE